MKKILLIILLVLAPVAAFPATEAELIRQAKAKYTAGQAEEAVNMLDGVVALSPSNQQAKKVLADICVDTGEREYDARNFRNAFEYFKKAVKTLPTHRIASERYWAMKNQFDVNNLKNEGGIAQKNLTPQPVQSQQAVAAVQSVPMQPAAAPVAQIVPDPPPVAAAASAPIIAKGAQPEAEKIGKSERSEKDEAQAKTRAKKDSISAEDEYLNKILQMEARFNKRMLEISMQNRELAMQREAQADNGKGTAGYAISIWDINPGNKKALAAAIITGVLSLIAVGFLINLLIKRIRTFQKGRNGKAEYSGLFGIESAGANYNELIKMQNIKDILNRIRAGETDWATVKKSISDMDRELRIEILNIVENKLNRERQALTTSQADLLTCLMLDGDEYLRKRTGLFMSEQIGYDGFAGQKALQYGSNGTAVQLLPYRNGNGNGNGKGSLMEMSMIETLNMVIPVQKIIDRKVFKDNHSLRVGVDCYYMAGQLGLGQTEMNLYYIAGLLHDIGFLDIPSEIFNKRGALNKDEFARIKTHAKKGLDLLDFMELPEIVHDGILYHHERWDGGGYPENLKGKEIPLAAQIVSLFDVYEALVLPRPQRPPFPASEALKVIRKGAKKLFNPVLMENFQKMYSESMLSREEIWKE